MQTGLHQLIATKKFIETLQGTPLWNRIHPRALRLRRLLNNGFRQKRRLFPDRFSIPKKDGSHYGPTDIRIGLCGAVDAVVFTIDLSPVRQLSQSIHVILSFGRESTALLTITNWKYHTSLIPISQNQKNKISFSTHIYYNQLLWHRNQNQTTKSPQLTM